MRNRPHSNQGLTLVEVLIALLILGISAFGMLSAAAFSKGLQQQAVEVTTAAKVGQVILESFRKMPYIILKDAVPPGTYAVQDIGRVYNPSADRMETIIEPSLLGKIRTKLGELRLSETIIVEHATDAIRVSVLINQQGENGTPVAGMVTYIVKNGINFR